jgi:hypothetical protein
VSAVVLHPEPDPSAGPLVRAVTTARAELAARHAGGLITAGAADATVVAGPPDALSFGARLRAMVADRPAGGLVVLGSGAIPLATVADLRLFVAVAAADRPRALVNNRYSADVMAVACAATAFVGLPDLASDNAVPRWLAEVAGVPVEDRHGRWRLGVDIDGPLDLVLLGGRWADHLAEADRDVVARRLASVRAVAADRTAELVVAGRTSAASIAWLERATASRTRAIVEERGLRTTRAGQRPAASVLGALLERDGPEALGPRMAELGEAAFVDSRVLLAHRLGTDDIRWPSPDDRAASDLLLAERIVDPWLRALTASARDASIPIVLGGHTLVGPGLQLAIRPRRGPR